MKLEAFMDMVTKLKEMKPVYASCICSPAVYELIKPEFGVHGKKFIGIKIFKENHFPDDTAWLLDETHTEIYYTYSHPSDILVIPEFPSFLILPLFMIATLLAVIIYRRKRTTIS